MVILQRTCICTIWFSEPVKTCWVSQLSSPSSSARPINICHKSIGSLYESHSSWSFKLYNIGNFNSHPVYEWRVGDWSISVFVAARGHCHHLECSFIYTHRYLRTNDLRVVWNCRLGLWLREGFIKLSTFNWLFDPNTPATPCPYLYGSIKNPEEN